MIPAEAVEAAAARIFASESLTYRRATIIARVALDAAAPHMLAEAWQAGHTAGDGDQSAMWDARNTGRPAKYADIRTPNPYKDAL